MGFFGKVILGIVAISAIVVFFRSYHPGTPTTAAVVLAPSPIATNTSDANNRVDSNSYLSVEGTALMDTSAGLPAVPFIQYVTNDHTLVTKQLIFANSCGCSPNAGDLPCVPPYGTDSAYPDLTTGERIAVKGYVRADRFLVYEIDPL